MIGVLASSRKAFPHAFLHLFLLNVLYSHSPRHHRQKLRIFPLITILTDTTKVLQAFKSS